MFSFSRFKWTIFLCTLATPTPAVPDHTANPDLVTGLEWNDPTHCNRLSCSEHRRLCVMMTKIAHTVRLREMVLRPYFQDYELVAKNVGTVTLAHFSRVLHFIGVVLSAVDFALLVKRFMCDSYTVNFIAFVEELEQVVRYLDGKRLIDRSDVSWVHWVEWGFGLVESISRESGRRIHSFM